MLTIFNIIFIVLIMVTSFGRGDYTLLSIPLLSIQIAANSIAIKQKLDKNV